MMVRLRRLLVLLVFPACGSPTPPVRNPDPPRTNTAEPFAASADPPATAPTSRAPTDTVTFTGMCDASGAVPLSAHVFAVADDEDNVLRVYDADRGGAPLYEKDISQGVDILPRPRKDPTKPPKAPAEADLEAATRHDALALWLTSHGRNSSGKLKPERFRFFATTLPAFGEPLTVVGEPYAGLITDLDADPRFARYDLAAAARLAPKAQGGLNIEGMTDRDAGGVFIGFRSPTPDGRALLFILENPQGVIQGEPPQFDGPITLDLGGLGVRGLSSWHGRYLIVAGHYATGGASRLYSWDGTSDRVEPVAVDLSDLNPEGFFTPEAREQILLLSDDGSVSRGEVECKKLDDRTLKAFRGRWIAGELLLP